MNSKETYFSGQGKVTALIDGKKIPLGNCTDLILYKDNKFVLVLEQISHDILSLFSTRVWDTKVVFDPKRIQPCIIELDGVNTADSMRPFTLEFAANLEFPEGLSFIQDNLAKYIIGGDWTAAVFDIKAKTEEFAAKSTESHQVSQNVRALTLTKITSNLFSINIFGEEYGTFNINNITAIVAEGPNSVIALCDERKTTIPVPYTSLVSGIRSVFRDKENYDPLAGLMYMKSLREMI